MIHPFMYTTWSDIGCLKMTSSNYKTHPLHCLVNNAIKLYNTIKLYIAF